MKRGIDGISSVMKLLRNMYGKKRKICVDGLLSEIITDEAGVNQGGPNSPDISL